MFRDTFIDLYRSPSVAWLRPGWRMTKRIYYRIHSSMHGCADHVFGGRRFAVGGVEVRVPSQYGRLWAARELYSEEVPARAAIDWCRRSPNGIFVDVGADIGFYSLLALAVLREGHIFALDSSLNSLAICSRICSQARQSDRMKVIHGLVTDVGEKRTLAPAIKQSECRIRAMLASTVRVLPEYVVIGQPEAAAIPYNTLDELFADTPLGADMLVKIDIEGAEARALAGSFELLSRVRPTLLLSIHPDLLLQYKSSKEEVLDLLARHDYRTTLLSSDHEEHWWCEPNLTVEQASHKMHRVGADHRVVLTVPIREGEGIH